MPFAVWAQPVWHRPIRRFSWGGAVPGLQQNPKLRADVESQSFDSARAGSNVEKCDIRVEKCDIRMEGSWRFRAVKTLGKTLYSYLRLARYLKHVDLELMFRDHVCSVLDHRVDIRYRYRDRY